MRAGVEMSEQDGSGRLKQKPIYVQRRNMISIAGGKEESMRWREKAQGEPM
jgi:hypothetical protein